MRAKRLLLLFLALFITSVSFAETREITALTGLNLRSEPNGKSTILKCIPFSDEVEVLGKSDSWLKVKTSDQKEGWIHEYYTELVTIPNPQHVFFVWGNSKEVRMFYLAPGYDVSYEVEENGVRRKVDSRFVPNKEGLIKVTMELKKDSEVLKESREIMVFKNTAFRRDVKVTKGVTSVNTVPIVNKKYSIPESLSDGMNETALMQFMRMRRAARKEGIKLDFSSSYRSYKTQKTLYNYYLKKDPNANNYSAKPGQSEHQLGLAFDLVANSRRITKGSRADRFLTEHAFEYGFILRYPEGKKNVTGYIYEPWHYRYVGPYWAKLIKESGVTLDEFFAVQYFNE
ncbi:D-alanyl-D-alanine carboxypeptidase family protein [Guggenheimella bovis]